MLGCLHALEVLYTLSSLHWLQCLQQPYTFCCYTHFKDWEMPRRIRLQFWWDIWGCFIVCGIHITIHIGSTANTFLGRSIYHKVPAILKKSIEYHYPNAQQPGKDFESTYTPVVAEDRSWPTDLNFSCGWRLQWIRDVQMSQLNEGTEDRT